jgi:glycerol-3-phosphate acyltransferase PlsY
MAGEFIEFFTELLFGSGHWIGLILFIVLMIVIGALNRYASIIGVVLGILLSFEYMKNSLGWDAIVIFISSFIIMIGDIALIGRHKK